MSDKPLIFTYDDGSGDLKIEFKEGRLVCSDYQGMVMDLSCDEAHLLMLYLMEQNL